MEVLGLKRPQNSIVNLHGEDLVVIPNIQYCEDLHYHSPSNSLFAASEENTENRWKWFPPYVFQFSCAILLYIRRKAKFL